MTPTYKIHPAIGIARVGNSSEFYLAPEKTGGLPIQCNPDGTATQPEQAVTAFKDAAGAIKQQAARFRVFVYDAASPGGRELQINDRIQVLNQRSGQIMTGNLTDVIWTVYLANKKASWYEFDQTSGEHGYAPDAVLRNADITDYNLRQKLIIDPGTQSVALQASNAPVGAQFAVGQNPNQTFPPPLVPNSITTLGQIMATKQGAYPRLVVLGGNGNSGSSKTGLGEPHIQTFANNDGWFDDVSDGPVTAQLMITVTEIDGRKLEPGDANLSSATVAVDDPAWVIVGYPRYAPELVDIVTMDDVVYDLSIRNFGFDTYMFGVPPFKRDSPLPANLEVWRKASTWNPNYYPYFWQEVWPILSRPYYYQFVMDFDAFTGGDPHETARGSSGNMDPDYISIPPFDGENPAERENRHQRRAFVYHMIRKPGRENRLTPATSSLEPDPHPYAMPYLCGDNPISNTAASKFLRLTDTQLFILRQWAEGKFINEKLEQLPPLPIQPGVELDRGVLGNVLGGAFMPGAEACWIMRNPAIYSSAYRVNQASYTPGGLSQPAVVANGSNGNAVAASLAAGLEPGDLTKYDAIPWQADFNECSTQVIDITYDEWCEIYPGSTGDPIQPMTQLTYWWPVHRPMEVTTYLGNNQYGGGQWSPTAQTHVGDLQMVSEWASLGFILRNPAAKTPGSNLTEFVNVPSGNMNVWEPAEGTK
ncbi:MAG: LodA/GoxA family CTQ-dependent oxidase [Candidatus Korobacteraceae bacterium]